MKRGLTIFLIIIIILCLINDSFTLSKKKIKKSMSKSKISVEKSQTETNESQIASKTPKAVNLQNHYGGPSIGSQYGPEGDPFAQYVEANPDTFLPMKTDGKKHIEKQLKFRPYPGEDNKFNPSPIKSGDMTNIAPSAEKIITPEIATPKLNVQTQVIYPAAVALPTFKGMKKEFHDVTAYDKEERKIVHDKVLIEHPEMVMENHVFYIIFIL